MSIKETAWRERGRALYDLPESASTPAVLPVSEARETVAHRLRAHLGELPAVDRDAAVAAAARGFLQAHRARGPLVVDPRPRAAHEAPEPVAITFTVTRDHALTKGLAGGRVRIPRGESPLGAVARRIARDTHCEVLAMEEDDGGADGREGARHLRVTLRGSDGTRGSRARSIEGTVWVKLGGRS